MKPEYKKGFYNSLLKPNEKLSFVDTVVANDAYYKMTKSQVGMSPDTIVNKKGDTIVNTSLDYVKLEIWPMWMNGVII